jgi:hypothetical protein
VNKQKLTRLILMITGGILVLIAIIKFRTGFYLSDLPLFLGILIVGGIIAYIASKIKPPSSEPLSLEGMWSASDGSTKIFGSNGLCQNMMAGPTGGSQTYVLSGTKDNNGRYTLVVSQPPNERTLYVNDSSENKVDVFDNSGNLLWTMTKKN